MRATARESSSCSASTRMARSAPMASPVRSCSDDVLPPMLTSTTSAPPPLSFRRSASSMAISSNGLTTYLRLSVTMPLPSGLTLMRGVRVRHALDRNKNFHGMPPRVGIQNQGSVPQGYQSVKAIRSAQAIDLRLRCQAVRRRRGLR